MARTEEEKGKNFMEKFMKVAPFHLQRIQTDNGSEFENHFRKYLKDNEIIHYFSLNKMPPLKYFLNTFVKDPEQSNMFWNYTLP